MSFAGDTRTGFSYGLATYILAWIVVAFLWGMTDMVAGRLVQQAGLRTTTAAAQTGLGWAELVWTYLPLWAAVILFIHMVAQGTFSGRRY